MKMFEFVCYIDGKITGEEYVVAESQERAKEVLIEQMAKDDLTFDDFNQIEINAMDSRKSIKFTYADKPIKVSQYLKQKSHEHFVGSTAPEMGHIDYMMDSKRFNNGFGDIFR